MSFSILFFVDDQSCELNAGYVRIYSQLRLLFLQKKKKKKVKPYGEKFFRCKIKLTFISQANLKQTFVKSQRKANWAQFEEANQKQNQLLANCQKNLKEEGIF